MAAQTIAEQIQAAKVPYEELDKNYRPMLEFVRQLIGVVPNCDNYLEIWPPGFRTYNLIVPNALNLPVGLARPYKDLVGLGMYASSRAAGCPYCTSHTCSFAMRRGASVDSLVGERSAAEAAVVDFAEAVSRVPSELTRDHVAALGQHLDAKAVEPVVLGVLMMGFLNKFMDAIGVELEEESLNDVGGVLGPTGWSPGKHVAEGYELPAGGELPPVDGWRTALQVIRRAPGAVRLERPWLKGVPSGAAEVATFLSDRTGAQFEMLGHLNSGRARRAFGAAVALNLDPHSSKIGVATKALAGLVFATHVGNEALANEARALVARFGEGVDEPMVEAVTHLGGAPLPETDQAMAALVEDLTVKLDGSGINPTALILARAVSPSPAEVTPAVLSVVQTMEPAHIIEVVVWLSVKQLLHRLVEYISLSA